MLARTLVAVAAVAASQGGPSAVETYALRLGPGTDLKPALLAFAREHDMRAGFVVTAVGSLDAARIRFANQPRATDVPGKLEIVSLVGTLTRDGAHLHLSVADGQGRTIGGHLMDGCPVYTTAEIMVGEARDLTFTRPVDPKTTYPELKIEPRAR